MGRCKWYIPVFISFAIYIVGQGVYSGTGKVVKHAESPEAFFNTIKNNCRLGKYGPVSGLIIKKKQNTVVVCSPLSNEPLPLESITKSITSLVLGIAVRCKEIESIDQCIVGFFPEYRSRMQQGWKTITLRDLLTMRSGILWDEDLRPEPLNPLFRMYKAADVYDYIFAQEVYCRKNFNYSSANTALLSRIILTTSHMSFSAYADSFLFKPLGIRNYKWTNYANGITNTSAGLSLLPADLLKIGELCLREGRWNENQIVSEQWIRESFTGSTAVKNYLDVDFYGYSWWINSAYHLKKSSNTVKVIAASGYNNNHLILVPEKEVIIVVTGYSSSDPEKYLLLLQDVLQ